MGVSLNPESFVAGGLLNDVDVTFKSAEFALWDYNGSIPNSVPALKIVMTTDGEDHEQYYSMGSADDWMPSDDGKELMAVGGATEIRSSCKGAAFLSSLVNAGFPAAKLGEDISIIVGTEAHIVQKTDPKRGGDISNTRTGKDGKEYERTTPLVESISKLPKGVGGKAATKPAGKAAGKGKTAPAAAASEETSDDGGGDLDDIAVTAVMTVLAANPEIDKTKLPAEVYKLAAENADVKANQGALLKLVFADSFLAADGRPWTFDGAKVSL